MSVNDIRDQDQGQANELIFYDLPSKDPCASWSPNPLKIRLALNYKSIPYNTTWIEYPDIAPTFKAAGVPPNPPGNLPYTVPAIHFPCTKSIEMDSLPLAQHLESLYPPPLYPSLHLSSPNLPKIIGLVNAFTAAIYGEWVPLVPDLLNEKSREYVLATREERFGMSIEQLVRRHGGEGASEVARKPLRELAGLYEETEGPFVEGEDASYADFVVVAYLHFFIHTQPEKKTIYHRIVGMEPALGRLYEACGPWLERDGY